VRPALVWPALAAFITAVTLMCFASMARGDAPPDEWWDSNYQYRHKISVTAGSTNVPTDYSVRTEFDHAALVAAVKSLSSGDDIRIAHWNGSTWTELDRRLDDQSSWDSATTQVWFRTQAAINATATDDDYYLYYGYDSAGSPPTTWSNVFLFYDDFNDGSFDTGRWSCTGTCNESGGTLTLGGAGLNSKVYATATYSLGVDTRWETRVQLGGDGSVSYFNYCAAGNTSTWGDDWIDMWTTSSTHYVETADEGTSGQDPYTPTTPTSFHVYAFTREGTTRVRYYQDDVEKGDRTANVPDENLRFLSHNDNTTSTQIHDWVRVRKYVSPEPTNVTGGEEPFSGAIVFDAASNSTGDGDSNTIDWYHTVTSGGSERILVVGVSWRNSGTNTYTVDSVTYNSLDLTEIRKDEKFEGESRSTALYYLTDPPTGSAYLIEVDFTGTVWRSVGGAVSLTGVDQTNPIDDLTGPPYGEGVAGATGTNPSVTVTTNTDGAWVVDTLCIRNASGTTSVSGGQTERWNYRTSSENIDGAGSALGPNSPAGDVTMSWSTGTNDGYSMSAVPIKPATGGGSAAFNYLGSPQDVSPSTAGSWVDVDVSAYIPSGATGVILQWSNPTATDYVYGVRNNGSSDDPTIDQVAKGNSQGWFMIGVDSNRIFEVYVENTGIKTYLLGYTMGGVTFFTNWIDKTPTTDGTWQDVDISSDTGGDTAIGAIFYVLSQSGNGLSYGLRKNIPIFGPKPETLASLVWTVTKSVKLKLKMHPPLSSCIWWAM